MYLEIKHAVVELTATLTFSCEAGVQTLYLLTAGQYSPRCIPSICVCIHVIFDHRIPCEEIQKQSSPCEESTLF